MCLSCVSRAEETRNSPHEGLGIVTGDTSGASTFCVPLRENSPTQGLRIVTSPSLSPHWL
jgi:hypothetical protein